MAEGESRAPFRILIIDHHVMFRDGIKLILQRDGEFEVSAETADAQDAIMHASTQQPDLVLLGLDANGLDGLDIIKPLMAAAPHARIVVLGGARTPALQEQALRHGAKGFVGKDQSADTMLQAIRKVREGQFWFDRRTMGSTMTRMLQSEIDGRSAARLTSRERDIIRLVGDGLRNDAIAERLTISEKTVRNHLTVIFEKVDVADRLNLALYAYRHRLAKVPD